MFEQFTERARQVVVLAQDEARALKHSYIGTEHILLGLLREEEGLGARVLTSLDITVEEVRQQVARNVGLGDEAPSGQIPLTPRAKKVLELALREALSLGHNYIGTEHILLGLVREYEGVAARILLDSGVDAEKTRSEIIRILSGPNRQRQQKQVDSGVQQRTYYNHVVLARGSVDPYSQNDGIQGIQADGEEYIRVTVRANPDVRVVLDGTFYLDIDLHTAAGISEAIKLFAPTTEEATDVAD